MAAPEQSFKDGLFKITNKPITKDIISKLKIELEDAFITHFVCYRNDLDFENTIELCKLITKCKIQYLYLWVNNVNDITCKNIALSFQASKYLVNLDLSRNVITDEGAAILASSFTHDSVLTSLDLSYNLVTDIGVEYLAAAMNINLHLTYLNLTYNKVTDKGADVLLNKVKTIPYLCSVFLNGMELIKPEKLLLMDCLGKVNAHAREIQAASLIKFARLLILISPELPQEVVLQIIGTQMACFTPSEQEILTKTIFSKLFVGWFHSSAGFKVEQLLGICRGFIQNRGHFENLQLLHWERQKAQRDYQMLILKYQRLVAERRKMMLIVSIARAYGPLFSWFFNTVHNIFRLSK